MILSGKQALPEKEDTTAHNPDRMTLGDLLAEYDVNVLKRWAEEQHLEEAAQEVPEERK